MGAATVARLHADPTFRADMEAARAEFAAIRTRDLSPTRVCAAEAAALAMGFQASDVTAIDIILEPDATMLQHAEANNARLLKVFPGGFALDASHTPHITMIQRIVRTADLDKVYAAAAEVFARADVTAMKLEAFKYYYAPSGDTGSAGIVAKPTPELIKLQADLIAAVTPFAVETGASAFVTTPDDPMIDPGIIFLMIQGIAKVVFALTIRPFPSWGWVLASGILSIVLSLVLLGSLPEMAAWLIGLLIGIELIGEGAAMAYLAWQVRRA